MPKKKGESVSIRVHPTIKAVIDYIIAEHRARTGEGLTNDQALWVAFRAGVPDAVEAVTKMGAPDPTIDKRKEKGKDEKDGD